MHEFVQNSVFIPRSERFVIFALGAQHFSNFSKVHEFAKRANDQHVMSFSHLHHFSRLSAKCTFVQNSVFSSLISTFFHALGVQLFSDFQQSARVRKKQRFKPEIRTFCHFRSGQHHLLSGFKQSAWVCTKQKFFQSLDQHVLSFSLWVHYHFLQFSAKCTSLYKTAFSAHDHHVSSFSHWVDHFF